MSDASTATGTSRPRQFLHLWNDVLAEVLQQVAGPAIACILATEKPAGLQGPAKEDLRLVAVSSGALRGEFCFRVPAASITAVARIFLGISGDSEQVPDAEAQEAVVELWRQVGGRAATAISGRWGQVQLHLDGAENPPSWPVSAEAWLKVSRNESEVATIETQLSPAIVAALCQEANPEAVPAESMTTPPPDSPDQSGVKLDLLMHADLAVTLRFGHRRMLLREILELNTGAVIELDRNVNDPVDLLLDGRIVARGEVVVLDGNFGLRVTELGSGI
jgi:flagellar motor switch protein FliN/FliY